MSKRWYLVAAYSLIWLASSAVVVVLYCADITPETIARNISAIRIAIVLGASISATLISILFHLYFRKLKLLEEHDRLVAKVRNDFAQVRTLRGIVSVCCYCKKVHNGKGYWEQIEEYVTNNSHARFSHGICPKCLAKLDTEICSPEIVMPAGAQFSAVPKIS